MCLNARNYRHYFFVHMFIFIYSANMVLLVVMISICFYNMERMV